MFITGDIRSYRSNEITRTISFPSGIKLAFVLLDDFGENINEVFNGVGEVIQYDNVNIGVAIDFSEESVNFGNQFKPSIKLVRALLDLGLSPFVVFLNVPKSNDTIDYEELNNYLGVVFKTNEDTPLLKRDITFLFVSLPSISNNDNVASAYFLISGHIEATSNKFPDFENSPNLAGQRERYFIVGEIPNKMYIEQIRNSSSLDSAKRTIVFTGNFTDVSLPLLYDAKDNPSAKYIVNGVDMTYSLIGIPAIIQYIVGDLAMPLTQKTIGGINLFGEKIGVVKLSDLYAEGASLLLADEPNQGSVVCYRSNLLSYGKLKKDSVLLSYPEDVEFNIMFIEDLMDKENRNYLKQFRGWKATKGNLEFIKNQFDKVVLSSYKQRGWVDYIDRGSLKIWMDENDLTLIRGYYKYRPVYPINKIWIEHFFIV